MSLVNMQRSAEEAAEYATAQPCNPSDTPKYPWGLNVELNDETMKKLGIELPTVGATLMLMARVQVTSVGSDQQIDGDKNSRCSLQITDMALSAESKEGEDPASKLWPDA